MTPKRQKQLTAQDHGASAIKMDLHLRKLVHRPKLLRDAIISREQAALTALFARTSESGGLFTGGPSPRMLSAGQHALQRRLARFATPVPVAHNDEALVEQEQQVERENAWARRKRELTLELNRTERKPLLPFPLAVARLLDASAEPLPRTTETTLLQAKQPKVPALIDDLVKQGMTDAGLVQAAAQLLSRGAVDPAISARRIRAELLLSRVAFTTSEVSGLRALVDEYWVASDQRGEFAALQMMVLLGDLAFVQERYERLNKVEVLSLIAMAPATFMWAENELQPARDIVFEGGLVVVDGQMPPVMRDMIAEDAVFTARSLKGAQAGRRGLVASFCPFYSMEEEILSFRTEDLAARMCAAALAPYKASKLSPLIPVVSEVKMRLDDLLFASLLPLYSFEVAVGATRPTKIAIFSDKLDFAVEAARVAARVAPNCEIFATVLRPGDGVSEDLGSEQPDSSQQLIPDTMSFLDELGLGDDATATGPLSPSGATLFCGRPFDRNYITDLRALAPIAAASGDAHLLLSAQSRVMNGRARTLLEVMPESGDLTVWEDAEKLSRTLAGRAIPESLKDHGARVVSHFISDQNEPLFAVLNSAEPQLRRFFERTMPATLASAALVRRAIRVIRPSRVICLPGRDWLSRMAVKETRLRLGANARSFDIQTVFIAPRLRYKRTTCDTQIAIETFSAGLFARIFDTPSEMIAICGSPRYAATLKAARAEAIPLKRTSDPYQILFMSSPIMERCMPVAAVIRDYVMQQPDTVMHLRTHPSSGPDDIARLKRILSPLGHRGVIQSGGSLAAAIVHADAIVTRFSNTGLEAAMVGKDVIAADFIDEAPPVPLGDMGVAIGVNRPEGLMAALRDVRERGAMVAALARTRARYFELNPLLLNEDAARLLWQTLLNLSRSHHVGH
jgi:hypothetical protein